MFNFVTWVRQKLGLSDIEPLFRAQLKLKNNQLITIHSAMVGNKEHTPIISAWHDDTMHTLLWSVAIGDVLATLLDTTKLDWVEHLEHVDGGFIRVRGTYVQDIPGVCAGRLRSYEAHFCLDGTIESVSLDDQEVVHYCHDAVTGPTDVTFTG